MCLSKHIEELCQAVSKESDGEKLLSLVDELNRELEHASETPAKDKSKGGVPQRAESTEDAKSKPNAA